MNRWPEVDRQLRRQLLNEIRRRHTVDSAAKSATERLRRAEEIAALAAAAKPPLQARSDEPVELWQRLKAKWRATPEPT
jgi:hypothetical protein